MDVLIVAVIVAVAAGFTIRGFIRIYKGEKSCSCGDCACGSKQNCFQDPPGKKLQDRSD